MRYPRLRNNVQEELLRLPEHFVVTFHSRCCLTMNGFLFATTRGNSLFQRSAFFLSDWCAIVVMTENLKEQRQDYRKLLLVETTGKHLSGSHWPSDLSIEINISESQLKTIFNNAMSACVEKGGHINLGEVIRIMVDDVKLILEKEQVSFIASHGMRYALFKSVM